MKVLFLLIAYPDVAVNTNMYTSLSDEFRKNGHEVFVAAPGKKETAVNNEGGITVLRVKTFQLFNVPKIYKGIANILLPYQYKKAIVRYFKNIRFDLVITATPPITFIETAGYLKGRNKSKIYLILRDIFPQNAKDLGLIKNPLIFFYFRRKEKKLYHLADSIGCMSPRNVEYIHKHNPELSLIKLHLLPNWTKINDNSGDFKNNNPKYDFKDKFVAVFGGNFGVPQKIEFLIEVAEKLKDRKDILFYLVGEGTEMMKIKKLVSDKQLQNVILKEQIPREEYLELLSECHVGLVNLSDKFTIPNIPSRTLSYWSLRLPVLAAIDQNTDFGELLDNCQGGLWSITGNTEAYINNMLTLYNNQDLRKSMGENGYNYVKKELNPEKTYRTLLSNIFAD
jgi:glycosyltransferase involved in cell wall biosynthesis